MTYLREVLFHPFAFWQALTRSFEAKPNKPRKQKTPRHHQDVAPQESRKYRLERGCSNYRSIHFPR